MHVDLFIRTYRNDLEWLGFALKSIHKYVTGYRNIIIAIPMDDVKLLSHLTQEKVVGVHDLEDGYLGQQLTKMQAWKLTDADAIVFWDSDVVATRPIDVRTEYFKDDKVILYKTRYSSINKSGHECPWQPITAKALGFTPEWEYMRRMPLVYRAVTLMACTKHMEELHGIPLEQYIRSQPHRAFSEFNVIGAFAEKGYVPFDRNELYAFVDTESIDMPPCAVDQMWSWGGLTNEVKIKLASYGLE